MHFPRKAPVISNFPFHYNAFGLSLASELQLPELTSRKSDVFRTDVEIALGDVPEALNNASHSGVRFQTSPGSFLLRVDNIARYLVVGGEKIIIQSFPGAVESDIRLFLLGSAFAALFHQRGLFPLHASAVRMGGECVLFCGASGNGKSTLAHAFVRRGYALLTDDVCVVEIGEGGRALAHPGYPQLKLWKDSLVKSRLLEDAGDQPDIPFKPVRPVLEKYAVPVNGRFYGDSLPIRKIYILSTRNAPGFELTPLSGMDKFKALKHQTYRFQFTRGLETQEAHFRTAGAIGARVPAASLARPQAPFLVNELADLIEKDLAENTPAP